jgi:hypothetical protein
MPDFSPLKPVERAPCPGIMPARVCRSGTDASVAPSAPMRLATTSQRAHQIGRRKEIYEALHPETRHEAFKGNQHTSGSRKFCDNQPERFTASTAKATGRSEGDVQREKRLAS